MEYKEFERIISAKRMGRFFLHVTQSEAKSLGNVHSGYAPLDTQNAAMPSGWVSIHESYIIHHTLYIIHLLLFLKLLK